MQVFTYAERPDLSERLDELDNPFPEFMHHGEITGRCWAGLRAELPELQLVLYDEERDRVVGKGQTVPARAADGLPGGVDDVLEQWFGKSPRAKPDVLSALVAMVAGDRRGEGLSALVIEGMCDVARRADLPALIAPVRPTRKADYPLISLERYARWTREDGLPFDPWIRLHARLGAEILEVCPASMTISGTVAEWEEWTGLTFPEDGEYVVRGGLVPVRVKAGRGVYVEPNLWMRHSV